MFARHCCPGFGLTPKNLHFCFFNSILPIYLLEKLSYADEEKTPKKTSILYPGDPVILLEEKNCPEESVPCNGHCCYGKTLKSAFYPKNNMYTLKRGYFDIKGNLDYFWDYF